MSYRNFPLAFYPDRKWTRNLIRKPDIHSWAAPPYERRNILLMDSNQWYKVEFSVEQRHNREPERLAKEFEAVMFRSLKRMTLFRDDASRDNVNTSTTMYFPPNSLPECLQIMHNYGASPCDQPDQNSVSGISGTGSPS